MGKTLGRYELLRPLAKGGMAEVYLARRRVAGVEKRLVIKRMRREHSRDPRFLDLFVREAQLSMSLVQQNIVPVFDFGRIGDDVFLAMEHIDGKDLGSTLAIDRTSGMPPVIAAYIAAQCCQALDHAHRRRDAATPHGVIHRDVTPRNVLVSWAGDVLLADFGIASVVGQAAGDTMGTPGYMAPEQALGEPIDARADVYALGIVLWESVTGTHVRPAGSRAEAVAAARTGELPPIADIVPPGLAAVIRKATAVAPADRYDSARSMADALDGFIVGERAREGGAPPARQLGEWLRERWSGDTDAESTASSAGELGHIVTFLDDGVDGVRSTRTQRSAALTADADPPVKPQPGSGVGVGVGVGDQGQGASPRRWWLAGAAVLVMAGAVAAYALRGPSTPANADRPPAPPVPAPVPVVATVPDPVPPTPTPTPTPTPIEPAPTLEPAPAPVPTKKKPPRAGSGSSTTAPVATVERRAVTLGAVPWANVTVDGDPTVHETPATIQLAVGSHRVTYSNPQLGVTRTVTVTVPAEGPARHVEDLRQR